MDPLSPRDETEAAIVYCCGLNAEEGGCYHCRQKLLLINLACAWAFDLGMSNG